MQFKAAKEWRLFSADYLVVLALSSEHWKMNACAEREEEHLLR